MILWVQLYCHIQDTLVIAGVLVLCSYNLSVSSSTMCPEPQEQRLCYRLISSDWELHAQLSSVFWPVLDFCYGFHIVQKDTSLMRVGNYICLSLYPQLCSVCFHFQNFNFPPKSQFLFLIFLSILVIFFSALLTFLSGYSLNSSSCSCSLWYHWYFCSKTFMQHFAYVSMSECSSWAALILWRCHYATLSFQVSCIFVLFVHMLF